MEKDITNSNDIIDIRDVIERFEELENELTDVKDGESKQSEESDLQDWIDGLNLAEHPFKDAITEYKMLAALLEECKGNGGDEDWRGDWYPITLIRESHFEDYAQELAEDIGAINRDAIWPNNCIDWEQAAQELLIDYTDIEFDGVTYYCR